MISGEYVVERSMHRRCTAGNISWRDEFPEEAAIFGGILQEIKGRVMRVTLDKPVE